MCAMQRCIRFLHSLCELLKNAVWTTLDETTLTPPEIVEAAQRSSRGQWTHWNAKPGAWIWYPEPSSKLKKNCFVQRSSRRWRFRRDSAIFPRCTFWKPKIVKTPPPFPQFSKKIKISFTRKQRITEAQFL